MLPFGLDEFDVRDVINIFGVTGLIPDDERYYMKASPSRVGDFFELFPRDHPADGGLDVPRRRPVRADVGL